ncbi:MAG: DUF4418 family protein [Mailhella sp.]|nr:DUF4418 family protein [Mailhella sp.]
MKDKSFSWLGGICAVLGMLIVLTPYCIFPVCTKMMQLEGGSFAPMKCFWTARSVLGNGSIIILAGIMTCLCRTYALRAALGVMASAAGMVVVLTPSFLIGVCAGETMRCRMQTAPSLYLLGLLTIVCGLALAWRSARMARKG